LRPTRVRRPSGKPFLPAQAGLFGLDVSIARRRVCLERLDESLGGEGDVVDSLG